MDTAQDGTQDLSEDTPEATMGKSPNPEVPDSLARLEEMTSALPDLTAHVAAQGPGWVQYEASGLCFGSLLFRDHNVAVQRVYAQKDTSFPVHKHDQEIEVMGIITGSMVVQFDEEQKTYNQYEVVVIPPGAEHSAYFGDDTWLWAVTMPAAGGYPSASS
jgi:quercetin dioxygenase-like cupin family protein